MNSISAKNLYNQDYENLEILIVDDNSSDQTVCKSEELLKKIGVNYKII